jgi:hypothetical protein
LHTKYLRKRKKIYCHWKMNISLRSTTWLQQKFRKIYTCIAIF